MTETNYFIHRVYRDSAYIADLIIAVEDFHRDIRELTAQILER